MNVALPPELAAAIAHRLEGVSRKDLAARAEAFSAAYRSGGTSRGIADAHDVLAYLVARLPATYAAVFAAFEAIRETQPAFAPASILDVGAGPGAASWAAQTQWPSLNAVTMLDHNAAFREIARELWKGPDAKIVAGDIASAKAQPKADLVVASYVLAELPEERAPAIARNLWSATTNTLLLVEPGTPQGFARIRAAREALVGGEGAHVIAPCTHNNPCPMKAPDWCHFSQRLPRSRDHMLAKDASVPFEDERFSYIAVSRFPAPPVNRARIVKQPEETRTGIGFPLCDDNGLHTAAVNRRDKAIYNLIKKAKWGDVIVSED
ncbi:MAG TPA: small ribosomal subunit Rsm22 family protein [Rhizomicrobium sp.]|jgi:ribosomal protein RSM22 (predicted rRNA methylase)|nr:small ribosomal subunit Rsm22 family protein [Rhizomicrobium sp.]